MSRICGYPGDGINGVLGALDCAKHKIEFIQVRREEMAAFMASAYAKFTGELGVCLSTGGPGALHLITGLYDAEMDHMPVLACGRPSMKKSAGTRGRVHPSLTIQAMACRIGYRIRRLASRGDL